MTLPESLYGQSVTLEHRQSYGQFFTPPSIAEFMCRWVLDGNPGSVFDPAFGMGAFFLAAKRLGFSGHFFASELDATVISFFERSSIPREHPLHLAQEDYLQSWGKRYDGIVCNPPYMRFQMFESREAVRAEFESRLGVQMSGYTNIASAFLLKSLSELKPGGRLAYVIPVEFLNTGYGGQIKSALLERDRLKAIVRIEGEESAFSEVVTTICIVLVADDQKSDPVLFATTQHIEDFDLEASKSLTQVDRQDLASHTKWLPYFDTSAAAHPAATGFVPLSTFGRFSRGIATGANEFFALSRDDLETYGLEDRFLSPCITKSSQISGTTFTDRDWRQLIESGAPAYVFDVRSEPSPAAIEYIKLGESKGYDKRYLTRMRSPWYKLERRKPFPILLNVFSRGGYKVIRNRSAALSFTCYHGFAPDLFGAGLVDHLFLFLISEAGRKQIMRNSRRYGRGLDKFEPNDLNEVLIPTAEMFGRLSDTDVLQAVQRAELDGTLPEQVEEFFAELLQGEPD